MRCVCGERRRPAPSWRVFSLRQLFPLTERGDSAKIRSVTVGYTSLADNFVPSSLGMERRSYGRMTKLVRFLQDRRLSA